VAVEMLEGAGFRCFVPEGAYYVMTDIAAFGAASDTAFAKYLVEQIGVAAVPGSSFYLDNSSGFSQIRFCFCKKYETLVEAGRKLALLAGPSCA
jgi:aminotransferase